MDDDAGCSKQRILRGMVAASIAGSARSLSSLQGDTGFHRSKLGRMRQGGYRVTLEEAEIVLKALGRPARALLVLACLGTECDITPEVLSYLDSFMDGLPGFIERLNALGSELNPKWAAGSVRLLADVISEHADRLVQASAFQPTYGERTTRKG